MSVVLNIVRWAGGLAIVTGLVLPTLSFAAPPDVEIAKKEDDQLFTKLADQMADVETFQARFNLFRAAARAPVPFEVLSRIAEDGFASGDVGAAYENIERNFPTRQGGPYRSSGRDSFFATDGTRVAERSYGFSFIDDGDGLLIYGSDNKQLTIRGDLGTTYRRIRLGDFRMRVSPADLADASSERIGERIVYKVQTSEVEFDRSTGLVRQYIRRAKDGTPSAARWQIGTLRAAGTAFPRYVLTARFSNGRVTTVRQMLLKEVKVNEDVADSTFVLPIGENATVVDFREDPYVPHVVKVGATSNVRATLGQGGFDRPAAVPLSRGEARTTGGWGMVFLISGAALASLLAGWLLVWHQWRRSSK